MSVGELGLRDRWTTGCSAWDGPKDQPVCWPQGSSFSDELLMTSTRLTSTVTSTTIQIS